MAAEKEGKLRKAILFPLCFLSFFYGAAVWLRVLLYRRGIFRTHAIPCKVVSVGNLTLGGTGKTPFVALLADLMKSRGIRPAILSRGYKGSFSGPFGVVSDGERLLLKARQAGDEPFFLAKKLRGIPVFIGRDRRLSGMAAVDRFQVRAVILDDGFQHLALKRDLNLLLFDSLAPAGNGRLFPRGVLREPLEQARRADAVILTKADLSDNIEELKKKIHSWAPGCPIFSVRYAPVGVIAPVRGTFEPFASLRGKNILAFTGIAAPHSFRRLLDSSGARISAFRAFPDHYWYKPEDFRELMQEGERKAVAALVTTEKDAVRLEEFPGGKIPLWAVSVRHEFLEREQDRFEKFVWAKLGLRKEG